MTRTTRSFVLLAFAVVLIGLLLLLVPNLRRIELQPRQPNTEPLAGVETVSPSGGTKSPGAVGYRIFLQILFIGALASLALIAVGAIFGKSMRIYLLMFAGFVAIILGVYYFAARAPDPEPRAQESSGLGELLETEPSAAIDQPAPPPPPGWAFPAVAILISIGVAVLFAVAWLKLAPRWRSHGENDKTQLEELVETVGSAVDEIQLGGDPRSAVLRCYREMVRILCRSRSIDHVHMTARELADALHRAGFTAAHVDRLTEIFELVRYGNRGGRILAEQAIGCLEAIREAYAT